MFICIRRKRIWADVIAVQRYAVHTVFAKASNNLGSVDEACDGKSATFAAVCSAFRLRMSNAEKASLTCEPP